MKKLSNLKGAKALNRQEQKSINGGAVQPFCYDAPLDQCPKCWSGGRCCDCVGLF